MRNYNENAFAEAITGFKKHTGDTACVTALEDMLTKLNDAVLINHFIREGGKLMTDFRQYFKGIEDVPTTYSTPLFDHFQNRIARDPFRRTKAYVGENIDGDYEHDKPYLSIISHLDCTSCSIINHLKRNLGIFERGRKLA